MGKYNLQMGFGPKVVAIGGGTGLSTMLRGLKRHTYNITAIVAVTDDGGGSGMLRQDLGMLPPGDIRHCMESLANTEPIMQELLAYRFTEGSLAGQSFGNLLLAALNGISDSFDEAVEKMSKVLAITGRVLPVTNANVDLVATFENGTKVIGESKIFQFKKAQDSPIAKICLQPNHAEALPDTLEAIEDADLILLGPGSLYTSVIPNLLVEGIPEAIEKANGFKMYVCNIMTQDGETEGMTAGDHIQALMKHGTEHMIDACLVNCGAPPEYVLDRYKKEGAAPVIVDKKRIEDMGIHVFEEQLYMDDTHFARHSPDKLAEAVMKIYKDHCIRLYDEDNFVLEFNGKDS